MTSTTSSAARRCIAALAAACIAACAESHVTDDAGAEALDAAVAPDARESLPDAFVAPPDALPIDAFVCPDADGDGFADTSCGGDDCDDTDPALSPEHGPCASPTSAIRCRDGASQEVACPVDTPECNASTGECVPPGEACGDGVLHPSEQCDAGEDASHSSGCNPDCIAICTDRRQCPPSAPYCTDRNPGVVGLCSPGNPGGAMEGTPCITDDECESGLCDREQRRCTQYCSSYYEEACPGATRWCGIEAAELWGFTVRTFPFRCTQECARSSECAPGNACTLFFVGSPSIVASACHPISADATANAGDACRTSLDCLSGPCLDALCTTVCSSDADCPAALPSCEERDLSDLPWGPAPRPVEIWGTAWPRVCSPTPGAP